MGMKESQRSMCECVCERERCYSSRGKENITQLCSCCLEYCLSEGYWWRSHEPCAGHILRFPLAEVQTPGHLSIFTVMNFPLPHSSAVPDLHWTHNSNGDKSSVVMGNYCQGSPLTSTHLTDDPFNFKHLKREGDQADCFIKPVTHSPLPSFPKMLSSGSWLSWWLALGDCWLLRATPFRSSHKKMDVTEPGTQAFV